MGKVLHIEGSETAHDANKWGGRKEKRRHPKIERAIGWMIHGTAYTAFLVFAFFALPLKYVFSLLAFLSWFAFVIIAIGLHGDGKPILLFAAFSVGFISFVAAFFLQRMVPPSRRY